MLDEAMKRFWLNRTASCCFSVKVFPVFAFDGFSFGSSVACMLSM